MSDVSEKTRKLPAVDRVLDALGDPPGDGGRLARGVVVEAVRGVLGELRRRIREGEPVADAALAPAAVALEASARMARTVRGTLRPVVNMTGVVVHTNLGRAPLSRELLADVVEVLAGYSNLEYDLDAHGRGSRYDHVAGLLRQVIPAEAALVVNNNAAAVLLILAEFARGREVVLSRGELIEIGGGFRIPEVMAASGARLVEVGTTNRTRADDFARAIGPDTAMLFKAHRSNFKMIGFTEEVGWGDLATLAREHGVMSVADLGSGLLMDPGPACAGDEPTPASVMRAGFDLACFSGDKMLGGPQAGIIVGQADAVARLRRNPLLRALRVGKFTIAALEATLARYLSGRTSEIPVGAAFRVTPDEVRQRCRRMVAAARRRGLQGGLQLDVVATRAEVGGGSMPGETLASFGIAVSRPGWSESDLEAALRGRNPPILGRVTGGRLVLDALALLPGQDAVVSSALSDLGALADAGAARGGEPA